MVEILLDFKFEWKEKLMMIYFLNKFENVKTIRITFDYQSVDVHCLNKIFCDLESNEEFFHSFRNEDLNFELYFPWIEKDHQIIKLLNNLNLIFD